MSNPLPFENPEPHLEEVHQALDEGTVGDRYSALQKHYKYFIKGRNSVRETGQNHMYDFGASMHDQLENSGLSPSLMMGTAQSRNNINLASLSNPSNGSQNLNQIEKIRHIASSEATFLQETSKLRE